MVYVPRIGFFDDEKAAPAPHLVNGYKVIAEFVDGHQIKSRTFRTIEEAERYKSKLINDNFDGYHVRSHFYPSFLIRCEIVRAKMAVYDI